MNFWRKHWFDVGGVLAVVGGLVLALTWNAHPLVQNVLGLNLIALLLHQVEEYRWPGGFPQMVNGGLFRSVEPNRYPLNPQTSLVINVGVGWMSYAAAFVWAEAAPWLGIAAVLVSVGNTFAHTVLFNVKGKSWWNPGEFTSLTLFLPLSVWYFVVLAAGTPPTWVDWTVGAGLGIALNAGGIVGLIELMKDENTPYSF